VIFQSKNKQRGVQNFVIKVINNNCPEMKALFEGPRRDKRVNLTLAVLVIPLLNGKLQSGQAFNAVTRELSINGVGIVLDGPMALDDVIMGFRMETDLTFVQATAKHLSPMGGGFYHMGLEMTEVIPCSKYPELKTFIF
jgi:hypothetical protein